MTKMRAGSFQIVKWMNGSTFYLWANNGQHTQCDVVRVLDNRDVYVQLWTAASIVRSHI